MAVDVVMPQMGESIFEGTITKWLKKPGDRVERDEPLFEISTDKVDAEIPSPAAGVLQEIKVPEGGTVPIQTIVALIAVGEEAAAPAATRRETDGSTQAPAAPAGSSAVTQGDGESGSDADADEIRSSPLVRRLARENGIDLGKVRGTGAGGRISKQDVLAAVAAGASGTKAAGSGATAGAGGSKATEAADHPGVSHEPSTGPGGVVPHAALETAVPRERIYFGRYQVQPLSVIRQRIAEHMVLSKRVAPHVYSVDEADVSRIVKLRADCKEEYERKHQTKLTLLPFFVRACVATLREFPTVNSSLDGSNVVLHEEINIGMAVAIEGGLIVPVLKNCADKSFVDLQRSVNDLAERARTKKLRPEEVQESTFCITNPGTFGGLMGLPIINQPNVAILGLGAIQKRAVVIEDAIAIRSMVYLTMSYDHRVVDGAVAHQFMGKVKGRLEHWDEKIL